MTGDKAVWFTLLMIGFTLICLGWAALSEIRSLREEVKRRLK